MTTYFIYFRQQVFYDIWISLTFTNPNPSVLLKLEPNLKSTEYFCWNHYCTNITSSLGMETNVPIYSPQRLFSLIWKNSLTQEICLPQGTKVDSSLMWVSSQYSLPPPILVFNQYITVSWDTAKVEQKGKFTTFYTNSENKRGRNTSHLF